MANVNEFSQPIKLLNGGPLDAWAGPYDSIAAANAAIANVTDAGGKNLREGKSVLIGDSNSYVLYRWKGGFADSNLVTDIPVSSAREYTQKYVQISKGASASNTSAVYDIKKNGYFLKFNAGDPFDGQSLWLYDRIKVFYANTENKKVGLEFTIVKTKGSPNPTLGFTLFNRQGNLVNAFGTPSFVSERNKREVIAGYDVITYNCTILLRDQVNALNPNYNNEYFTVSAFVQMPQTGTAPLNFELYCKNRSVILPDEDFNRNKIDAEVQAPSLPVKVTNIQYSPAVDGSNATNNPTATEATIPALGVNRVIGFDCIIRNTEALRLIPLNSVVKVKFNTDNIRIERLTSTDDYLVATGSTVGVAKASYVTGSTVSLTIDLTRVDLDLRLVLSLMTSLIDPQKPGKISLRSVECYAQNNGVKNPVEATLWKDTNNRNPIPYFASGEAFYGGVLDKDTGILTIPRRITNVNPNYLAAIINLEPLRSAFTYSAAYSARIMSFTWLIKVKIKGFNFDSKDDAYYNSRTYVSTIEGKFPQAWANKPTLATTRSFHYPSLVEGEDPFFILRYEYLISESALPALQVHAMLSDPFIPELEVSFETMSISTNSNSTPDYTTYLGRSVKQNSFGARFISDYATKINTGELKVFKAQTIGNVIEGSTGSNDTTVTNVVGYIGTKDVSAYTGVISSVNINVSSAMSADLVVGLIDQHGIIIPSVTVPISLSAGKNIIGYRTMADSPLPIKPGEQLFLRFAGSAILPAKTSAGDKYLTATNVSSPTVTEVSGKQLDFRYIIIGTNTPFAPIASKEEVKSLAEQLEDIANSGVKLTAPNGVRWSLAVDNSGNITAVTTKYKKIVAIGNSITRHEITSYWWGDWGMAASSRDKDWVHLVLQRAKLAEPTATIEATNLAAWEQATTSAARNALLPQLDSVLTSDVDCVIIRLSENVQDITTLQADYQSLIQYIRTKSPLASIFAGGSFWVADAKDAAIAAACAAENVTFSKQSHLDSSDNKSAIGAIVNGDDGQTHSVDNQGVANHPGDKGMEAISKIFINQIGL